MRACTGGVKHDVDTANSGMAISPVTPSWVVATPCVEHAPGHQILDRYQPSQPFQMHAVTQNFYHQIGTDVAGAIMAALRLLMTDFLL